MNVTLRVLTSDFKGGGSRDGNCLLLNPVKLPVPGPRNLRRDRDVS